MSNGDSDNDGEPNVGEGVPITGHPSNPYVPFRIGPSIPHYYGDYVRQIFIVCAAVMLLFAPFLASSFPAILPFEIGGALIFAVLGAMTNPSNRLVMYANALAAGVAVVVYELLALSLYLSRDYLAFIEREALAIAFLVALYFSLKTARNMALGRIGKRNTIGDFIDYR
ncbi:MAG TPA: hypothetical protein VNM40_00525 [Candidatus Paceibacterota bacterium]|nr:hypothetical protein [Candidatus Paceibacterota bacterium]